MNKSEKNRFESFLSHPFFTSRPPEKLLQVFRLLRDVSPQDWEKPKVQEKILRKLYPNAGKVTLKKLHQRLLRLNTQLKVKLEEFFVAVEFWDANSGERNGQRQLLLLNSLRQRGLRREFEKIYQALMDDLEARSVHDWNYYLMRREFMIERYNLLAVEPTGFEEEILEIHGSQIENVEKEYLVRILWLACIAINKRNLLRGKTMQPNVEPILEILSSEPARLRENVLLRLLYLLYKLLSDRNEAGDFAVFHQLLIANQDDLEPEQLLGLTTLGISYARKVIRQGNVDFPKIAIELLEMQLPVYLGKKKGKLPGSLFRNHILLMAKISMDAGNFDQAWETYHRLRKNVKVQQPEVFFRYLEGMIFYYQGKLFEAMKNLKGIWNEMNYDFWGIEARCVFLLSHLLVMQKGDYALMEKIEVKLGMGYFDQEMAAFNSYLRSGHRKVSESALGIFQKFCGYLRRYDNACLGEKRSCSKLKRLLDDIRKEEEMVHRDVLERLLQQAIRETC